MRPEAVTRASASAEDQARGRKQSSKPMKPHQDPATEIGATRSERMPWASRASRSLSGNPATGPWIGWPRLRLRSQRGQASS